MPNDLQTKLKSSIVFNHVDQTSDGDRTLTLKFDLDPKKFSKMQMVDEERNKFLSSLIYQFDKLIDVNKLIHLKNFRNTNSIFETRPVVLWVIRYKQ